MSVGEKERERSAYNIPIIRPFTQNAKYLKTIFGPSLLYLLYVCKVHLGVHGILGFVGWSSLFFCFCLLSDFLAYVYYLHDKRIYMYDWSRVNTQQKSSIHSLCLYVIARNSFFPLSFASLLLSFVEFAMRKVMSRSSQAARAINCLSLSFSLFIVFWPYSSVVACCSVCASNVDLNINHVSDCRQKRCLR